MEVGDDDDEQDLQLLPVFSPFVASNDLYGQLVPPELGLTMFSELLPSIVTMKNALPGSPLQLTMPDR